MSFWSDLWEGDLFGFDASDAIEGVMGSSAGAGVVGAGIGSVFGPTGALIGGGLGSAYGASQAQQQLNALNQKLSHDQQQWVENMSNTAYQRSRADMEAAGLNPILMSRMGGASTPSYQLPSLSNPDAYMMQGVNAASVNAMNLENIRQQIATQKSQQLVNSAQAVKVGAEAQKQIYENIPKAKQAAVAQYEADVRAKRPGWLKTLGTGVKDTWDTILAPLSHIGNIFK